MSVRAVWAHRGHHRTDELVTECSALPSRSSPAGLMQQELPCSQIGRRDLLVNPLGYTQSTGDLQALALHLALPSMVESNWNPAPTPLFGASAITSGTGEQRPHQHPPVDPPRGRPTS